MDDIPAEMRAAYITEYGPAEGIRVGGLPVPAPGPTDVLVRAEALAVNHVDTFVRSGAYRTHTPFPFVIGRDLVGTVAAHGDGVTGFRTGDRVWCNSLGHHGRQGSFAEYALVPAERLYPLPDGVAPHAAAGVLHTAATAHIALFREGGLRLGGTVVVAGAAGGVGGAAVQLAAAAGARIVATASGRDADRCRAFGAHTVIDYHDPDADARVRDAAAGADLYIDTSGRNEIEAMLPAMADGGRVIVLAGMSARPVLPAGELYTRDLSVRGFAISNAPADDLRAAAATINGLLAAGRLHACIGATLPLREAADAHRLLEDPARRPAGRIIVTP